VTINGYPIKIDVCLHGDQCKLVKGKEKCIIFKIAEPSLGCSPFAAGRASTIIAAKKIKYLSTG